MHVSCEMLIFAVRIQTIVMNNELNKLILLVALSLPLTLKANYVFKIEIQKVVYSS